VTPEEVVKHVKEKLPEKRLTTGTLGNWRFQSIGPAYKKDKRGRISYEREIIEAWIDEQRQETQKVMASPNEDGKENQHPQAEKWAHREQASQGFKDASPAEEIKEPAQARDCNSDDKYQVHSASMVGSGLTKEGEADEKLK
jgi:hypothetical protein